MPTIDYQQDGTQHEYEATTYTLMVYEQEFKSDLIKDVFGLIDLRKGASMIDEDGNIILADYTNDNWTNELKAFWAMLKTSEAIARRENRRAESVPSFVTWCLTTKSINMHEVSFATITELNRGLFRAGTTEAEEAAAE